MGLGHIIGWCIAVSLALIPFNWLRLWITGEMPKSSSIGETMVGTAILWAASASIVWLLLWLSKRAKASKAAEDQELLQLMAEPLPSVKPQKAILKPGETAHCTIAGELKEIKTTGYSAGSAGMSVRVAKGVTLRTASIRGRAQKGMVTVSTGELVVTDQRIIFAGDAKSFTVSNDKVLSTTNYSDGFGFTDGTKTYTVVTGKGKEHLRFAATLHKLFRS